MKKYLLNVTLIVGVVLWMAAPGLAFHDEGVARCNGCHTMHNMSDGVAVDTTHPNGNVYLLTKSTASDVCLSCHATGLGAVFGTDVMVPPGNYGGGNFVFLTEDNISDRSSGTIPGRGAGHNIIAPSKNVAADPVLTHSPGGSYPSGSLSCTSCHDPHGNEHFRMLYGVGEVEAGHATFTNPAPEAIGLDIHATAYESRTNHTAYLSGMSAWCSNCHGDFHASGVHRHPSGVTMDGGVMDTYDQYNGTMAQTSGTHDHAYIPEVAFEDPAMTTISETGPTDESRVSCITCHRAHGTSAPNSGRWDFNVQFLKDDGVRSGSYKIPSPYPSDNQRSLCNKCHNKDEGDHNPF